jgi:hypothetical protein
MSDVSPVAGPPVAESSFRLAVMGFVAGFLGVLIFHQGVLAGLHAIGMTPRGAWAMDATPPLGVPQVLSAAFWGGVWGVLFALLVRRPSSSARYLFAGLAFGALFPTLVAWFVVAPVKGAPVAGGWKPAMMIVGPLVNGAWGLGTALFLWLAAHRRSAVATT